MNNLVKDKPVPTQFISVFSQMIVKVSLHKIVTITRCKMFIKCLFLMVNPHAANSEVILLVIAN